MNKMDLVTNRNKLLYLQNELEDIGSFDETFHVSTQTGYGIEKLKEYLKSISKQRNYTEHPQFNHGMNESEKIESIIKQVIFERTYKEIPF